MEPLIFIVMILLLDLSLILTLVVVTFGIFAGASVNKQAAVLCFLEMPITSRIESASQSIITSLSSQKQCRHEEGTHNRERREGSQIYP